MSVFRRAFGNVFGTCFDSYWNVFCCVSASCCAFLKHFGAFIRVFGAFWAHFGRILGSLRARFGCLFLFTFSEAVRARFWKRFGTFRARLSAFRTRSRRVWVRSGRLFGSVSESSRARFRSVSEALRKRSRPASQTSRAAAPEL